MTLGQKLKHLRENKALTQEELSEILQRRYKACNISRNDLANWELGRHQPRWEKAKILCRYYQVTLDDLFFDHKTEFLKTLKNIKSSLKLA